MMVSMSSSEMYAQFAELKNLINFRYDSIDCKIIALEERFECTSAELKTVSTKVTHLEQRATQDKQHIHQLQKRIDELETHSRRVILRLMGVSETDQKNLRDKVVTICQGLLPELRGKIDGYIDVAQQLGFRKRATENSQPRGIIIRFTHRFYRDEVWKAARESTYLSDQGLQFKIDLSKGDVNGG